MDRHELKFEFGGQSSILNYFEITGKEEGPRAFISSGMHGNEINGIATVRKFLDWCEQQDIASRLKGRLTIIPVLNPSGFAHMQRRAFEDNLDPNRSYGFETPTSFSHYFANMLSEKLLRHHQFGIDIHDAGGRAALVPHSRIHSEDAENCDDCTIFLGRLLGTRLIVKREGNPHMLATFMTRVYGVPVLTVEAGGGQTLFPAFHDELLVGIRNVLSHYRMIDDEVVVPDKQYYLTERYGVNIDDACEVVFDVQLGDRVHAGDILGEIYFPHRHRAEALVSPLCGFLFSLWQSNQAPAGQRLYSILEDMDCCVTRSTLHMFSELKKLAVHKLKM